MRVRRADADASELVDLVGAHLQYRVPDAGSPCCLGHTARSADGASYVDCSKPPVEGRQCERCRTVDNVLAASMHQSHKLGRGAVDGRIASHLDQPHRLYVAVFRDGSIKVGTTVGAAGGHRLVEQGAWLARYAALAKDGFAVRELEDLVTETVGVQQAVTVHRKLAGLVSPRPDAELLARLDEVAGQVGSLVELMADPRIEAADQGWSNPALDSPVWQRVVRYPSALDQGAHDLTVVGAVGRVVAVTRPGFDEIFAADLAPLFGVELDVGEHEPDEVALQTALF
jgi:hypothetical protein